jgi:hypothetical protein
MEEVGSGGGGDKMDEEWTMWKGVKGGWKMQGMEEGLEEVG